MTSPDKIWQIPIHLYGFDALRSRHFISRQMISINLDDVRTFVSSSPDGRFALTQGVSIGKVRAV